MAGFEITHSGVTDPAKATKTPYGALHVSDFMDVWLRDDPAVGVDHIIYYTGDIGLRVGGKLLGNLPKGCPECGATMKYVDEPMVSGFRGHLCTNDECGRDQ
jgi:hypothetical protein